MNEQTKRTSMLDVGTEASRIDGYVKRPMRHPYTDGLFELGLGVLLAGVPLLVFLNRTAPSNSIWHHDATFSVCIAALGLIVLYGQQVLKKRVTYPRTGYVKYRSARTRAWIGGLVGGAIAIATVLVLRGLAPHPSEMLKMALLSAMWGLLYAFGTRMEAAWRWIVLVVLLVVPPAVTTLPLGQLWSGSLPIVLQGVIFAVSGVIALTLYLRRNPIPEQVAE